MYLDDGLGGASDFDSAEKDSFYINNSLSEFGFLIVEEKCMWLPSKILLGQGLFGTWSEVNLESLMKEQKDCFLLQIKL